MKRLRIGMMLPGLGRVERGAEMAFLELARQWIEADAADVDCFATGPQLPQGVHRQPVGCLPREWFERFWPRMPMLRTEFDYEELTYLCHLVATRRYQPQNYDVIVHCSYPYINWYLQSNRTAGYRPLIAFITQNGDWPCRRLHREYRYFNCDALVCINPDYYDRHRQTYAAALIPNGVDPQLFHPGPDPRHPPLPPDRPVILMACALVPYKMVLDGILAVAEVPEAFLAIAGDGPLRADVAQLAQERLPGRHHLFGSLPREQLASLYRQADLFLHMSRDEPFGLVYCEAASSGLPVVAHDGLVQRWILDDAALYTDTNNLSQTAAVLRQAMRPEIRRPLGERARERMMAYFTWPVLAQQYLDFFRERLAQHPHRREHS